MFNFSFEATSKLHSGLWLLDYIIHTRFSISSFWTSVLTCTRSNAISNYTLLCLLRLMMCGVWLKLIDWEKVTSIYSPTIDTAGIFKALTIGNNPSSWPVLFLDWDSQSLEKPKYKTGITAIVEHPMTKNGRGNPPTWKITWTLKLQCNGISAFPKWSRTHSAR